MECWGASGDLRRYWTNNIPGNGGFCYVENYSIQAQTMIYVCVGSSSEAPNYNNRSTNIYGQAGASGGGATNITTSNRGELKNFSSHTDDVLLVAGGGGGCEWFAQGGAGGGKNGLSGSIKATFTTDTGTSISINSYGTGGTQSSGGKTIEDSTRKMTQGGDGGFGYGGGGAVNSDWGAQGGSGWYGGGGSVYAGAAGGGSSYIKSGLSGSTIAGDSEMPSPNGGKQTGQLGNGVCIISQTSFQ